MPLLSSSLHNISTEKDKDTHSQNFPYRRCEFQDTQSKSDIEPCPPTYGEKALTTRVFCKMWDLKCHLLSFFPELILFHLKPWQTGTQVDMYSQHCSLFLISSMFDGPDSHLKVFRNIYKQIYIFALGGSHRMRWLIKI